MSSRTDHARLALAAALFAASLLVACVKKPTVTAYAGCGPLPPPETLCLDTLPKNASDAEVARCYALTTWQLLGENARLRAQFKPCAK